MSFSRGRGLDLTWNRRNLLALIALCTAAGGLLTLRGIRRVALGETIAIQPQRVQAATEKVNPNVASIASLRRLPGIGPEIARRIVEYRRTQPPPAFATPDDLRKVRGIGPKTVLRIRPLLELPSR